MVMMKMRRMIRLKKQQKSQKNEIGLLNEFYIDDCNEGKVV